MIKGYEKRRVMVRKITCCEKTDRRGALKAPFTAAIISDLHNGPFDDILQVLQHVDAILVPGDLLNRHEQTWDHVKDFLAEVPLIAPTYFSVGNHERYSVNSDAFMTMARNSEMICIDHRIIRLRDDLVIAGIPSQVQVSGTSHRLLQRFSQARGFRLLLCHHPEYYPRFIQGHGVDLTVSGHAHGGQIQLFGRGLFAPGQGLFPSLTAGFYDGEALLISRGMTNNVMAPRFRNPCELILLRLVPADK